MGKIFEDATNSLAKEPGKFSKGAMVVIGRQITSHEAFEDLGPEYIALLDDVIAIRPGAAIAYEAGDVGVVISDKLNGKYSIGVEGKPAAWAPEDALSIAPDVTDGYPEGFVTGAKVVANRTITMQDIYSGKIAQGRIEAVSAMHKLVNGREPIFVAGEGGTIRALVSSAPGKVVIVVPDDLDMGRAGHPVQAEWFDLA